MEPATATTDAPVDDSTASSVDTSTFSDDALIDHYAGDESAKTEEAPATETKEVPEAKPVEEKADEPKVEAKTEEEKTEEPYLQEPEPENVKKAFKSLQKWHPEVAKPLRDAWFAARAYKELFPIAEARELRKTFSSVQEAQEARSAHADLLAVEDKIHSDPVGLLGHIHKQDPQGFFNLAASLPDVLYRIDPGLYRERVSRPAVTNYHDFYLAEAQRTGDADLQAAIEIMRDREQKRGGQPPTRQQPQRDPNDPVYQRLAELETKELEYERQAADAFVGNVNTTFNTEVNSEVAKILERSGAQLSPEGKEEIHDRVLADVKDELLKDQVLQRRLQFAAYRKGAPRDAKQQQETVALLVSNARRFIVQSTSEHLRWLTEKILAQNTQTLKKTGSVMQTKDIGSGSSGVTKSRQPLTKEQMAALDADGLIQASIDGLL